jgi:hypothetical protein
MAMLIEAAALDRREEIGLFLPSGRTFASRHHGDTAPGLSVS